MKNTKKYLLLSSLLTMNIHAGGMCSTVKEKQSKSAVVGNTQKILTLPEIVKTGEEALKQKSIETKTVELLEQYRDLNAKLIANNQTPIIGHIASNNLCFGTVIDDLFYTTKSMFIYDKIKNLLTVNFFNNENHLVLQFTIDYASYSYAATKSTFESGMIGDEFVVPVMGAITYISKEALREKRKEAKKDYGDALKKLVEDYNNKEKGLTFFSMIQLHYKKDAKIQKFTDLFKTPLSAITLLATEVAAGNTSYSRRAVIRFAETEVIRSSNGDYVVYGTHSSCENYMFEKPVSDPKILLRTNLLSFRNKRAELVESDKANPNNDNQSTVTAKEEDAQKLADLGVATNGGSFTV